MEKKLPLKRYGDHQELANLAAYLLSDYSDYINGEVITIDGGEWISWEHLVYGYSRWLAGQSGSSGLGHRPRL